MNFLAQAAPALKETGEALGKVANPIYGETTRTALPILVARIINGALVLLGIVFLALAIYGGYVWMMARGKEDEVERAKRLLEEAVIGLVIILVSYAITRFVVGLVGGAVGAGAGGGCPPGESGWAGYCSPWF